MIEFTKQELKLIELILGNVIYNGELGSLINNLYEKLSKHNEMNFTDVLSLQKEMFRKSMVTNSHVPDLLK